MKGPEIKIEGGESFNVTFNITDLGNPPVSLPPNWTVDGSTLENNRVTIIEYGLQFVDVLLDDKGDYKALFANKAGNTTFSFMVNSGFPIQGTIPNSIYITYIVPSSICYRSVASLAWIIIIFFCYSDYDCDVRSPCCYHGNTSLILRTENLDSETCSCSI